MTNIHDEMAAMLRRASHESMAREAGRQMYNRVLAEQKARIAAYPWWRKLLAVLGGDGHIDAIVRDCAEESEYNRVLNALESSNA